MNSKVNSKVNGNGKFKVGDTVWIARVSGVGDKTTISVKSGVIKEYYQEDSNVILKRQVFRSNWYITSELSKTKEEALLKLQDEYTEMHLSTAQQATRLSEICLTIYRKIKTCKTKARTK